MLKKNLILLLVIWAVAFFTCNTFADCPSTTSAVGGGYGDFSESSNVERIRGAIQMLRTIDTMVPTTRFVVVSDEGIIEGADTTPRRTLEMDASSEGIQLERISTSGKTSVYRLFGSPNSIGRILERLPMNRGPKETGLRFLGREQPEMNFTPELMIQQIIEASAVEGTRKAVKYFTGSTKSELAAESIERLAKLLKNGKGYRYKTTVGVEAVIEILESEEFQSEVEGATGETEPKVIELINRLNQAGLIRQAVARNGSGREGETINYYFEFYVEWSETGKPKQGKLLKLYHQFGD